MPNSKINLTTKSKVNNPSVSDFNDYSFEGEFSENMFNDTQVEQYQYLKNQKINFELINQKLEYSNLFFEYIWLGSFTNIVGTRSTNFLIRTNTNEDKQIIWHKYSSQAPGSGQNHLYLIEKDNKTKVKLTSWLKQSF